MGLEGHVEGITEPWGVLDVPGAGRGARHREERDTRVAGAWGEGEQRGPLSLGSGGWGRETRVWAAWEGAAAWRGSWVGLEGAT